MMLCNFVSLNVRIILRVVNGVNLAKKSGSKFNCFKEINFVT